VEINSRTPDFRTSGLPDSPDFLNFDSMAVILLTGGTGLIGKALTKLLLEKGHSILILSRKKQTENSPSESIRYRYWNPVTQVIDEDAIREADHVIHLAGANVGEKRWTKKRKAEILQSRTRSGELLVNSIRKIPNQIQSVICASAIGWYGPDKKTIPFTENDPPDNSFLGETCKLWEQSILPVTEMSKRLVILRTGIVLSNKGGAFVELKKPLHFGMAAILGSGKQIISWIHIEDICRLYLYALEQVNITGIYNAVAPAPVSNEEFTLQLAKKMRPSFFIPVHVPEFALRLVLGEMSIEVLKSATVSAEKIRSAGFQFLYPSLESALHQLNLADQ
jgi:uncharacterized protein (TIGR01777 family)